MAPESRGIMRVDYLNENDAVVQIAITSMKLVISFVWVYNITLSDLPIRLWIMKYYIWTLMFLSNSLQIIWSFLFQCSQIQLIEQHYIQIRSSHFWLGLENIRWLWICVNQFNLYKSISICITMIVDSYFLFCCLWNQYVTNMDIWVRSRNYGYLVTWFCYQLIAKPGNMTAAVSRPEPYI